MLSPKMQRAVRVSDSQLIMLSEKAHNDHTVAGYLYKRTADLTKWQQRWFVLYQNILFYYENDSCSRPSGIILLEGCYCDRLITVMGKDSDKQICFAISYRRENQRQYELKSNTEAECKMWIDAIREASFNKMLLQKEELEQKHLHLLEIVRSEKMEKWQYTQQCDELTFEIKKLRNELYALKKEIQPNALNTTGYISNCNFSKMISKPIVSGSPVDQSSLSNIGCQENSSLYSAGLKKISEGSIEMQKIKKVQSFFRGWLCRRRWKQIVEQYIKSPHAESMRKRNSLVFQMVEAEEEYNEQMEVLISCFLRPFKMAASSKKPPCSHEDVNSIFLNSESVLFLHQIFLKGLTSRMENWPTLVLGDLFDMLLPMLSIYQEYVRNHHYSLQVLTECKQTSSSFSALLSRLESKSICHGRSLETFLTYPMHQIPRYIITLHELLAHTPHDHVERKSLQNARQQLENLSRQMHDEVSETENLRKNLAVERMIVEGCDILLDVNQVFVRQGTLIQISEKSRGTRSRLSAFGGKNVEKETLRQCFLFSNHLILTTRQSDDDGRLNLVPQIGKIPLCDAMLVEDPSDQIIADDDELSICSMSSGISESSGSTANTPNASLLQNRDFKIIFDLKTGGDNRQHIIHLVAPTIQEKAAWISDICQCMDNVHFNGLLHGSLSDASSITMPHSMRNDPKLFKDDVDIRFSRTLNSCKVPQIRYATPERLLQRLTDLRFLSIDFLNTFLLTYRVFTDSITVLEALKKVFYDAEPPDVQIHGGSEASLDISEINTGDLQNVLDDPGKINPSLRRTSGASSVSGYGSEIGDTRETGNCNTYESSSSNYIPNTKNYWRNNCKIQEEQQLGLISEGIAGNNNSFQSTDMILYNKPLEKIISNFSHNDSLEDTVCHLEIPKVIASSSSETLTDLTVISAPSSPSNLSSVTLVGSTGSGSGSGSDKSPQGMEDDVHVRYDSKDSDDTPIVNHEIQFTYEEFHPSSPKSTKVETPLKHSQHRKEVQFNKDEYAVTEDETIPSSENYQTTQYRNNYQQNNAYSSQRISIASVCSSVTKIGSMATNPSNYWANRRSIHDGEANSPRRKSSHHHDISQPSSKVGVVITSFRKSHRRSSTSSSAAAFAIATSASSNPPDKTDKSVGFCEGNNLSFNEKNLRKESVMSTAATMRVLNVLRHWVSKHAQDFQLDQTLKNLTIDFLEDIVYSPNLIPAEHKAAGQLLRLIAKEELDSNKIDLNQLLTPPSTPTKESIETLSALEIAEQMTYLDHQIFISILSEEFLGQAWIKADKVTRAPYITLMTKRFNEVSQLVVSEIIRRTNMQTRVAVIEKWTAVADISRVLHNYNGVLQICAAFTNSSVYRLKRTWEKVSKTSKQTIERLQNIVSSEHRFRNLRDALHRCDPPCIPYLGLYLTDLSFIDEGTPNFTDDGLLNFSKMRMIAHVIREIRHFQQTPYKIDLITKVTNYLLDTSLLLQEEDLYRMSLEIEPRTSRLSNSTLIGLPSNIGNNHKKD